MNSCIVCGERVLAAAQKGGSLAQAASESLDWSASLRPGSNLYANICAAEIHPFIFFIWNDSLSSFAQAQHELICMGTPSLVP